MADSAGKITSAEISSEPTRFIASTITTAMMTALSAMRVFQNFRSVTVCSAVLSVSCAVLGILVSILAGTPVGSTIVAADILAFLICSALGRARGGETG